eukprot:9561999-Lingulodinium_polyedra.AAC.1
MEPTPIQSGETQSGLTHNGTQEEPLLRARLTSGRMDSTVDCARLDYIARSHSLEWARCRLRQTPL